MTPAEINTLILTVFGFLGALGAACKWVLMRVDKKQKRAYDIQAGERSALALRESEARAELSRRLHDEIRVLREELQTLHAAARVMMRRIYDLERTIHDTPGLSLPLTEGWPPV